MLYLSDKFYEDENFMIETLHHKCRIPFHLLSLTMTINDIDIGAVK